MNVKPDNKRMNKLPRSWVSIESAVNKTLSASYQSLSDFKVLQWNVLADGLAQNGNFIKVPSSVLEWEQRWPLILTEIQDADADLICLQEVNKYDDFFEPAMKQAGFDSFFLPKQESPAVKYGAPRDGCAIFYRSSKFRLKKGPLKECYKNQDGTSMNQGFIILSLSDIEEDRDFIVATTHLKAKNKAEEERTRTDQVGQLLEELKAFHGSLASGESRTLPIIVCGDFNAEPYSASCQLMRRNSSFEFSSIWDFKAESESEGTPVTTYKIRPDGLAKKIVDYVWFSSLGEVEFVKRWSMPSDSQIGDQGLPTADYGSDHIAICVQFNWSKKT